MLNSKYSKVLTVILIIAIIAIVGLLIFVGVDWYKAATTNSDTEDFFEQFNGYIGNIDTDNINSNNINSENTNYENIYNGIGNNIIQQENIIEEPKADNNNENNSSSGNSSSSGSSSSSSNGLTYKNMKAVGTIEIPKTKVKCVILDDPSAKAMDNGITVLYGPGVNQKGNTVLAGHNYRNGTFFSNNKKLSVGDKIYITDLKGKKVTYTITHKYNTDANDFSYSTRKTNGKRAISLTTCTDDSSARIIIWAEEK